jgi:hypothetical protein
MSLLLTAFAFLTLGHELSVRLWRRAMRPLEQVAAAVTIGCALWIGSLWTLALTGLLIFAPLAIRTGVAAVLAIGLWRSRDREPTTLPLNRVVLALLPVAVWTLFILVRGAIVPPSNHDALAYHLPKAVLYARAGGYDPLPDLPARARNIPVNYELMLAETLVLDGDDTITEWHGTLFYVFFLVASVALVQRWWGAHQPADIVLALVLAAVPVMLLHSGTHKNDLMTGTFMVLALLWLGRWFAEKETAALALLTISLVMATGTKPQAAMLALAAIPIVLARRPQPRTILIGAAVAVAAVALLGGAYKIADRLGAQPTVRQVTGTAGPFFYGDWSNLWQVPYALIAAPFSSSSMSLWVPWAEEPWFWRRYEVFFSDLGVPFAVCAVALPLGVFLFRREGARAERLAVSLAALAAFLLMLPVVFRPLGLFAISAPRYTLFILPVVFGWTLAPWLRLRASRAALQIALAVAITTFVTYGWNAAQKDVFAPLRYVRWAIANPGTRVPPFHPNRLPAAIDRTAGPDEGIAIEAADAAWLYPVFGAKLTRPVQLIPFGETNPRIASNVNWIIIDRTFASVWKHPRFETLSETRDYLARGPGKLDGDPLFLRLRANRDFRLVAYEPTSGQAVFRRRR